MIKAKARKRTVKGSQKKSKGTKPGSKKRTSKIKEMDPVKVRHDVANIIMARAKDVAEAVIVEARKGQLATAKYLFEVASVYPAPEVPKEEEKVAEGPQSGEKLEKFLLEQLKAPVKPAGSEEESERQESGEGKPAGTTEERKDEVRVESPVAVV